MKEVDQDPVLDPDLPHDMTMMVKMMRMRTWKKNLKRLRKQCLYMLRSVDVVIDNKDFCKY